jgi:hypothetical protein
VLTGSAVVRANGGSGNVDGGAGTINLDPSGTGGATNPNLTEQGGSVVQTLDGAGVDQSATNITRD